MSYKDDDSILFPTRFGPPIGTARERTMIDNCGGAFGIVSRVRENPDGSSTLLRTRAGFPHFETDKVDSPAEEIKTGLFLQTGACQLPSANALVNYAGLGSARGSWHFHVPTTSPYIGYISDSVGTQNAAKNANIFTKFGISQQPLYEGMVAPALAAQKDSSAWLNALFDKRTAVQKCPASIFSGKMRLFMQAQYGQMLTVDNRISSGGFGTVTIDGVTVSNLGGAGTGFFTTANNEYRIIRIVGSDVFIHKVEVDTKYTKDVSALLTRLKGTLSDAERDKLEGYVFAHCKIAATPSWALAGVLPVCNPVTYGWSFKWNGATADIISHEVVGTGSSARFHSTHYRLNITNQWTGVDETFAVSYSTISTDIWADGRGTFHIWAPDYATGGRMYLFSLGIPVASVPSADGKISCYYQRNDTLVVTSYHLSPRTSKGIEYVSGATWPGAGGDTSNPNCINLSVQQGTGTVEYTTYSSGVNGTEYFDVGGTQYGGSFSTRNKTVTVVHHGAIGNGTGNVPWYVIMPIGSLSGGFSYPVLGQDGHYAAFQKYYDDPFTDRANYAYSTYDYRKSARELYLPEPIGRKFYSLVIPFYDACAVYLYERDTADKGPIEFEFQITTSNANVVTYSQYVPFNNYNHPNACFYSDTVGPGNDGFVPNQILSIDPRVKDRGPITFTKYLRHLHGYGGSATPTEGSLVKLFIVDSFYPYYDALIWTSLPCGGVSGIDNPLFSNSNRRWTGWV